MTMSNRNINQGFPWFTVTIAGGILFAVLTLLGVFAFGVPKWRVWQQGLVGQASFERALQDRRIAVLEAEARLESSTLLAKVEIERAKGIAEANKIIGDSLKGNDAYLRYLWIDGLKTNQMQVVYVPTEAGLPILEAGKRPE